MRKKLLNISSLFLLFPAIAYGNETVIGIQELKKATAFILQDIENLKRKVNSLQNEVNMLKKENSNLKKIIIHNSLPSIFTDRKLNDYLLYTGSFRSLKGALRWSSRFIEEGKEPIIVSSREKALFSVVLQCNSYEECKSLREKYGGFISHRKNRGTSKVLDLIKLFKKAEEKLKNQNFTVINGIHFFKVQKDEREIRPYPHFQTENGNFIVMKLEGIL